MRTLALLLALTTLGCGTSTFPGEGTPLVLAQLAPALDAPTLSLVSGAGAALVVTAGGTTTRGFVVDASGVVTRADIPLFDAVVPARSGDYGWRWIDALARPEGGWIAVAASTLEGAPRVSIVWLDADGTETARTILSSSPAVELGMLDERVVVRDPSSSETHVLDAPGVVRTIVATAVPTGAAVARGPERSAIVTVTDRRTVQTVELDAMGHATSIAHEYFIDFSAVTPGMPTLWGVAGVAVLGTDIAATITMTGCGVGRMVVMLHADGSSSACSYFGSALPRATRAGFLVDGAVLDGRCAVVAIPPSAGPLVDVGADAFVSASLTREAGVGWSLVTTSVRPDAVGTSHVTPLHGRHALVDRLGAATRDDGVTVVSWSGIELASDTFGIRAVVADGDRHVAGGPSLLWSDAGLVATGAATGAVLLVTVDSRGPVLTRFEESAGTTTRLRELSPGSGESYAIVGERVVMMLGGLLSTFDAHGAPLLVDQPLDERLGASPIVAGDAHGLALVAGAGGHASRIDLTTGALLDPLFVASDPVPTSALWGCGDDCWFGIAGNALVRYTVSGGELTHEFMRTFAAEASVRVLLSGEHTLLAMTEFEGAPVVVRDIARDGASIDVASYPPRTLVAATYTHQHRLMLMHVDDEAGEIRADVIR